MRPSNSSAGGGGGGSPTRFELLVFNSLMFMIILEDPLFNTLNGLYDIIYIAEKTCFFHSRATYQPFKYNL